MQYAQNASDASTSALVSTVTWGPVDNLDEAAAELKARGATLMTDPRTIRPGVRIAFIEAPDHVPIELLERT